MEVAVTRFFALALKTSGRSLPASNCWLGSIPFTTGEIKMDILTVSGSIRKKISLCCLFLCLLLPLWAHSCGTVWKDMGTAVKLLKTVNLSPFWSKAVLKVRKTLPEAQSISSVGLLHRPETNSDTRWPPIAEVCLGCPPLENLRCLGRAGVRSHRSRCRTAPSCY